MIVDAKMMSYICFDVFVLGNHEFDNGDTTLGAFLDDVAADAQNRSCVAPAVLAANVVAGTTSPIQGKFSPYTIKRLHNGELIGIVGVDIRNKTMFSSSPSPGTYLTDEVEAVKKAVAELTNRGINKIIAVTHIGFDFDISAIAYIPGVDVIVGGDSHTLLGKATGPEAYPQSPVAFFPTIIGNTCVVTAWE